MFGAWWISLLLLLPGATSSFMIYNSHHSLCLEDSSPASGLVQLKRCNLDSELQQWVWTSQRTLKCVGTSRCLSARHADQDPGIQTVSCGDHAQKDRVQEGLVWDCEGDRLILQKDPSLELSTDGTRLSLSHQSKETRWRSVEEGDICKENLRSKRASKEPEEFEVKTQEEDQGPAAMTDEQREFLRWYYRTEDPTPWKFAMLGLSFACLLVGFLLLGMGSMANKNRKKIAKYKAAAALAQKPEAEEVQLIITEVTAGVTTEVTDHKEVVVVVSNGAEAPPGGPQEDTMQVHGHHKANGVNGVNGMNGDAAEAFKPGDIVVTWKDGNISNLYSDDSAAAEPPQEEQTEKEEEEEEEEKVEEEVVEEKVEVESAAETDDAQVIGAE